MPQVQRDGLLSDDATGAPLRFATGSDEPEVVASAALVSPTRVAVGEDGSVYAANFGYFPGQGQVVKLTP